MKGFPFAGLSLAMTLRLSTGQAQTTTVSAAWQPTTWNGERAFAAAAEGWTAVVSVERGRLVYLGRGEGQPNLLFAPPGRDDPAGWGGHRVWLGPQVSWGRGGWPPPVAWEKSAAERVGQSGERLELAAPDAGDGWPRLVRAYHWQEGRLRCTVRISGGTRAAQIIQIVQVPPHAIVEARALATPETPHGYTLVHLGRHPSPRHVFTPPVQIMQTGAVLEARFNRQAEKLGLVPQTLSACLGTQQLRVARGAETGVIAARPDEDFLTQLYLGNEHSPLIELEQLSPAWQPGGEASQEMILEPGEVAAR